MKKIDIDIDVDIDEIILESLPEGAEIVSLETISVLLAEYGWCLRCLISWTREDEIFYARLSVSFAPSSVGAGMCLRAHSYRELTYQEFLKKGKK